MAALMLVPQCTAISAQSKAERLEGSIRDHWGFFCKQITPSICESIPLVLCTTKSFECHRRFFRKWDRCLNSTRGEIIVLLLDGARCAWSVGRRVNLLMSFGLRLKVPDVLLRECEEEIQKVSGSRSGMGRGLCALLGFQRNLALSGCLLVLIPRNDSRAREPPVTGHTL